MGTYQALAALRSSGGTARAVLDDEEILDAQAEMARTCGLYVEASSAIVLPALAQLSREGELSAESTVVVVGTSSGLKDPGATARRLPAVSVIEAEPAALDAALAESAAGRASGNP